MDEFMATSDWKQRLTTVTPLSKYLAMVLFVALPFIGAYLGATAGKDCDVQGVAPQAITAPQAAAAVPAAVRAEEMQATYEVAVSVIELYDLHPTQGGYNITVRSDKTMTVERKRGGVDTEAETYETMLFDEEYADLARFFAGAAWGRATSIPGTGLPDESITTIVLYDPTGAIRQVSQPYGEMTPEFEEAYELLVSYAKAPLEESA